MKRKLIYLGLFVILPVALLSKLMGYLVETLATGFKVGREEMKDFFKQEGLN